MFPALFQIADLDRFSSHISKESFFSQTGRAIGFKQKEETHFTVFTANTTVAQRIHNQNAHNSIHYEIDGTRSIVTDIILASDLKRMLPRTKIGNDEYQIISNILAISSYPEINQIKDDGFLR